MNLKELQEINNLLDSGICQKVCLLQKTDCTDLYCLEDIKTYIVDSDREIIVLIPSNF